MSTCVNGVNRMRVGASTPVSGLAGAILKDTLRGASVELCSIGPNALNQATKAIIMACTMAADEHNMALVVLPRFETVSIEDVGEQTAIIQQIAVIGAERGPE